MPFALRSFSVPPTRHRPRSIIESPMFIRRLQTWSPALLVTPVRRLMPHSAITFARGLALVHHCGIIEASTTRRLSIPKTFALTVGLRYPRYRDVISVPGHRMLVQKACRLPLTTSTQPLTRPCCCNESIDAPRRQFIVAAIPPSTANRNGLPAHADH